ncbi:hypothetical protein [Methylotenera sp.]|uniref:hypothetical protein n=1 Tax=Methylotenera sp. TaxID=2051956 RepID=UPI0027305A3A|nr:hypothetical protein [Methylotenera sp.]MDP2229612.1 hypothetical protein [Methylotenera sp.]MDP3333360.1 hypothetical protein [Methylococcaceae bacterium]
MKRFLALLTILFIPLLAFAADLKKNFTYQEWIISASLNDIDTNEVGRCSNGSTVVDLINKIYWTC